MVFDLDMIKAAYAAMPGRIAKARKVVGKPLTLSEKILFAHLHEDQKLENFGRGKSCSWDLAFCGRRQSRTCLANDQGSIPFYS